MGNRRHQHGSLEGLDTIFRKRICMGTGASDFAMYIFREGSRSFEGRIGREGIGWAAKYQNQHSTFQLDIFSSPGAFCGSDHSQNYHVRAVFTNKLHGAKYR